MVTYHTFKPDGNKGLKKACDDLAKYGYKVVQIFVSPAGMTWPSDTEGWWILASKEATDGSEVQKR